MELSKSDFLAYIAVAAFTAAVFTVLALFLAFRFGILDVNRFAQPQMPTKAVTP